MIQIISVENQTLVRANVITNRTGDAGIGMMKAMMIALLKETSVAGYVAVIDLTKAANQIKNTTYDQVNPILLTALIYLAIVMVLTWLLKKMERRLRKSER